MEPRYKQIRKDGRYITIDTQTGQEVMPGEGMFKPVADSLSDILDGTLFNNSVTLGKTLFSDINNTWKSVEPYVIYSDTAVDKYGRPLTKAQAGEKSSARPRSERIQEIFKTAPQTRQVKAARGITKQEENINPRTGLPFSQSPGKPSVEPPDEVTAGPPKRDPKPTNWEQYEEWLKGQSFEGTPYSQPYAKAQQQAFNFYQPRERQQGPALPGTPATMPKPIIEPEQTAMTGLSARSRAILDAPMGEGPLATLRRADAAQGILRKDGKIAVNMGDGTYQEINEEGYKYAINNLRDKGGADLGQDFFDKYRIEMQKKDATKPTDKDSLDINNPEPATTETPAQAVLKNLDGTLAVTDSYNKTDNTLPLTQGIDFDFNTQYMRYGEDPAVTQAVIDLNPGLNDDNRREYERDYNYNFYMN